MELKVLITGILGVLIGVSLTLLYILLTMPSVMLLTHESALDYDATIEALQERIEGAGWVVSGVKDMNESLAKQGVDFKPRVTLVSLCHPDYAESILTTDRYMSVMMPCKFSVWEDDDGRVQITQMNTALMGKLFGGNVTKVMVRKAAPDEQKILDGLLKNQEQGE